MRQGLFDAVVIGASAGAFEALSIILPKLPANFKLPVMIVVHLPPDKNSVMADLLKAKCKIDVREAEDKAPIESGKVYLAPPDYHLLVEKDFHLSLSSEEVVRHSRPPIDVLFETAADAYKERLLGIILSGANGDGSLGLETIAKAGGAAWVQDPETAFATQMPREALRNCKNAQKISLEEMAALLQAEMAA